MSYFDLLSIPGLFYSITACHPHVHLISLGRQGTYAAHPRW